MTVTGYMDAKGVFREPVQEGSTPRRENLIVAPEGWGYGLRWDGKEWVPDETPAEGEIPDAVTPRQLYLAMTDEEFARTEAVRDQLPPRIRKAMDVATQIERLHPDTLMMMAAAGFTEERRDELFRTAAAIA